MKIYLNEQDVANAICVFVADLERIRPEEVQIEFLFNEDEGVSCLVKMYNRNFNYDEQQMSDTIGFFLDEVHRFSSHSMEIIIHFNEDEGITSEVSFTY